MTDDRAEVFKEATFRGDSKCMKAPACGRPWSSCGRRRAVRVYAQFGTLYRKGETLKSSRPVRQGLRGFATGVISPKLTPGEAAQLGPCIVIGVKESGSMTAGRQQTNESREQRQGRDEE